MQTETKTKTVADQLVEMLNSRPEGGEYPRWVSLYGVDCKVHTYVPELDLFVMKSDVGALFKNSIGINMGTIVTPEPAFKVGDRVVVVHPKGCGDQPCVHSKRNGEIGEVTDADSAGCEVKFADGRELTFLHSELRPAPPEPPLSERMVVGSVWEQSCDNYNPYRVIFNENGVVVTLDCDNDADVWTHNYLGDNSGNWTLITPAPRRKLADVLPVGTKLRTTHFEWEVVSIHIRSTDRTPTPYVIDADSMPKNNFTIID